MAKKILIVEDDPFTKHFYTHLFARTKYDIFQTEKEEEIFGCLDDAELSLIILDINLRNTTLNGEKTNGVELSKNIKKIKGHSRIPILLITAYNKKNYFEESLADDYIIKPITDFNELLIKIDNMAL
jgi:DNA-binding response OmpR family regulator